MTAPFDWVGLAYYASYIYRHGDQYVAAAYLRTRIEAEFVPVERYIERNRMWTEQVLATNEATARAEAAEAEVKRLDYSTTHTCWDECPRLACVQRRDIEALRAQLAEARQTERAAVVAYLRGYFVGTDYANAIEAGEHLT